MFCAYCIPCICSVLGEAACGSSFNAPFQITVGTQVLFGCLRSWGGLCFCARVTTAAIFVTRCIPCDCSLSEAACGWFFSTLPLSGWKQIYVCDHEANVSVVRIWQRLLNVLHSMYLLCSWWSSMWLIFSHILFQVTIHNCMFVITKRIQMVVRSWRQPPRLLPPTAFHVPSLDLVKQHAVHCPTLRFCWVIVIEKQVHFLSVSVAAAAASVGTAFVLHSVYLPRTVFSLLSSQETRWKFSSISLFNFHWLQ